MKLCHVNDLSDLKLYIDFDRVMKFYFWQWTNIALGLLYVKFIEIMHGFD